MPHVPDPQAVASPHVAHAATDRGADPDAAGLFGLVQRTCQALQAMAASLEALDSVLLRLQHLGHPPAPPTELMTGTLDTVQRVIALLRREGPPMLFRAQALRLRLRLHGFAAGSAAAVAMRALHADLDGLAAFQPDAIAEQAAHWGACVRRMRSNTMVLLAEFDGQRRRMTAPSLAPDSLPRETAAAVAAVPR